MSYRELVCALKALLFLKLLSYCQGPKGTTSPACSCPPPGFPQHCPQPRTPPQPQKGHQSLPQHCLSSRADLQLPTALPPQAQAQPGLMFCVSYADQSQFLSPWTCLATERLCLTMAPHTEPDHLKHFFKITKKLFTMSISFHSISACILMKNAVF